jgi:hypothetical protein
MTKTKHSWAYSEFTMSGRERDTVLCALRLLQEVHGECAGELSEELEDVRRNDHDDPLSLDEIDRLCERMNQ